MPSHRGVITRVLGVAAATALLLGCATHGARTPSRRTSATAAPASGPRFIEDAPDHALAEARRLGRPLFVDLWAPWCHTCLSLKAYVLRDPALAPLVDRFVWASVDTEKDRNAAFVARHPIEAWPTLLVLDPRDQRPILRWVGAATAAELVVLLDDAAAVFEGTSSSTSFAAAFVRGQRAAQAGRTGDAIAAFDEAAKVEGLDPGRRARVLEALIGQLAKHDPRTCARQAIDALGSLPPGTSRANVVLSGLSCAVYLGAADLAAPLRAEALAIAGDAAAPILADDRSALFESVVEAETAFGDLAAARRAAAAWATFLEGEAARAPDPAARAVFDAHRTAAYLALGTPEKALPILERSARDFPLDYNPPARLARVLLVLGRLHDARAAIDRALSLGYGPRKLRLFLLSADIEKASGDLDAERRALEAALAHGATLPVETRPAKLLAEIEARRRRLTPGP